MKLGERIGRAIGLGIGAAIGEALAREDQRETPTAASVIGDASAVMSSGSMSDKIALTSFFQAANASIEKANAPKEAPPAPAPKPPPTTASMPPDDDEEMQPVVTLPAALDEPTPAVKE